MQRIATLLAVILLAGSTTATAGVIVQSPGVEEVSVDASVLMAMDSEEQSELVSVCPGNELLPAIFVDSGIELLVMLLHPAGAFGHTQSARVFSLPPPSALAGFPEPNIVPV